MVSFQTPISPNQRKAISGLENLSKKRKWVDEEAGQALEKPLGDRGTRPISSLELRLETDPLPPEWQRCLNIKSGEMHYYNTSSHKRTLTDPGKSPDLPSSDTDHMSLDLELNLPCGSMKKTNVADQSSHAEHRPLGEAFVHSERYDQRKSSGGLTRSPSWLTIEEDQQEMVTAVCVQCHMLVLLCKSSPACPNCKYMHPPGQSPPSLLKQRFSLFC